MLTRESWPDDWFSFSLSFFLYNPVGKVTRGSRLRVKPVTPHVNYARLEIIERIPRTVVPCHVKHSEKVICVAITDRAWFTVKLSTISIRSNIRDSSSIYTYITRNMIGKNRGKFINRCLINVYCYWWIRKWWTLSKGFKFFFFLIIQEHVDAFRIDYQNFLTRLGKFINRCLLLLIRKR